MTIGSQQTAGDRTKRLRSLADNDIRGGCGELGSTDFDAFVVAAVAIVPALGSTLLVDILA